ncbi:SAV_2336 N-terminal domain-related protein [Streptomyces sp. NPDC002328]|uniref:SAV_2336 N-terminal domain-related protein n=1 Tax=Streptomyces sp. NPDC002328 TaxID=3364642 RepID=UPI0036AB7219
MTVAASLESLARRLREAQLTPDAEELADALWLARHLPGTPHAPGEPFPADAADAADAADTTDAADEPSSPWPAATRPVGPAPTASLAVPQRHRTGGVERRSRTAGGGAATEGTAAGAGAVVETKVPSASVLPDPLALQRALRPLDRYRPPSRPAFTVLDEEATAQRAADTGLVVPVASREHRREARLQLVMDVSSSAVVWRDTFTELLQVCERAGAFREIQTHYVHEGGGDDVRVTTSPDPAAPADGPRLLRDPSGRQLTLVLSDCAGPLWRAGRMQRLLYAWATCAPVAVIQPLPQRMWRGTHLPAFPGELRRGEGPAGGLEFRSERGVRPSGRALPVPVLALRPASVGTWVRLVCDATAQRLSASAAWARADHPAAVARPLAEREISARDRVRAFRRSASQDARQLGEYLATVPLVLPVMQLVQRAMLPGSGPEAMAEVLLGGLMKRDEAVAEGGYEFIEGVREELLRHLPGGEARLVLKHSSYYVEQHYGRSARNFPALAAAYLSGAPAAHPVGEDGADDHLLRAFARVTSQVLARYGRVPVAPPGAGPAELASRAHVLLTRYAAQKSARDLDEGIVLLRRALEVERRQADRRALRGRLAGALLDRWLVAGAADNLREAYEALPRHRESAPAELITEARILLHLAAGLETAGAAAPTRPPSLDRDLGEPQAGPERLALLAYEEVRRRLEEIPPTAEPSLVTRGIELRATAVLHAASLVTRAGAAVLGPADEPPGEWAAQRFALAAGLATQHRLRDERAGARLFEARVLLALARHGSGRGALRWEPDSTRRELAYRAAELAEVGLREALPLCAAEGARAAELARICLDTAAALDLTRSAAHDLPARRRIVDALDEALEYAGHDEHLRAVCLDRLGEAHLTTYEVTGDAGDLEAAVRSWWRATAAVNRDDPARPRLLHRLGLALTRSAEWNDAVRVLRTAVDEVSEHDPELPRYRVELGEALLHRYLAQEGLADLHEADWILGTAARETDDDLLAARAWQVRAQAVARLAEHTSRASAWDRAADHLLRSARLYAEQGQPHAEARARVLRGQVLARASAPARAAEEYEAALRLLGEAGLGDADEARQVRDALGSLRAATEGDA